MRRRSIADSSERIGNVVCEYHDDSDPSCAIYQNIDARGREYYTYYCFACKAHGYIRAGDVPTVLGRVVTVASDKPKPDLDKFWIGSEPAAGKIGRPFAYVYHSGPVQKFCTERHVQASALYNNNVRYNPVYKALVWQCHTFNDDVTTAQVRFLEASRREREGQSEVKAWAEHGPPKIMHLTVPNPPVHEPKYARILTGWETWTGGPKARWLIVSESFMDGLAISSLDIPASCGIMSILSTNFSQAHLGVIHRVAQANKVPSILLAFDTDKSGLTAEMVYSRYLRALGYTVSHGASSVVQMYANTIPIEIPTIKVYDERYLKWIKQEIKND